MDSQWIRKIPAVGQVLDVLRRTTPNLEMVKPCLQALLDDVHACPLHFTHVCAAKSQRDLLFTSVYCIIMQCDVCF